MIVLPDAQNNFQNSVSNCNDCKHKNGRCYCPPGRYCTAYEKERHKVKHTFEFDTWDYWEPGRATCWVECPFSLLIPAGKSCKFLDDEIHCCPFLVRRIDEHGDSQDTYR